MNILFSSLGIRGYLCEYFTNVEDEKVHIFGADSLVPFTLPNETHRTIVPPSISGSYITRICDIIKKHRIDLVIPLHDLDSYVLARNRSILLELGAFPLTSPVATHRLCLDKMASAAFLQEIGINAPPSVSVDLSQEWVREPFPAVGEYVIKSRFGFGGIGTRFIHENAEIEALVFSSKQEVDSSIISHAPFLTTELIFQPKIRGREFNLDVINDCQGNHVATIVLEKQGDWRGETGKAVTRRDLMLEDLGANLGNALKHSGPLDVDVIIDDGGMPWVLDLNPRISGAYPFEHVAGARLPDAIVAWATGSQCREEWFQVQGGVESTKVLTVLRNST
jgi:carbamoyl-phosphate synthase large subunit